MISKTRKKVLDELKQLKIRQRCIEKGINTLTKMDEFDEEEKKFYISLDKLRSELEANQKQSEREAKATLRDLTSKIHKLKKTIMDRDDLVITTPSSDLLTAIAEINTITSENLFVCEKELESLKYQNDQLWVEIALIDWTLTEARAFHFISRNSPFMKNPI